MIYLKAYKIFESQDLTSDIRSAWRHIAIIRDCFLSVSDMTHVKVTKTLLHNIEVSIGLSHRISPDESGISKWDVRYKELINGDVIAEEIANSISICIGLGLKVKRAEISWVNAGEWKLANPDLQGDGPGLLKKIFEERGVVGPIDMIDSNAVRSRYSPEILPDFIIDKGTRLRHIRIVFY